MNYNKLYGVESGKIYYACDKNCPVCEEWRKPFQYIGKCLHFSHFIVRVVTMLTCRRFSHYTKYICMLECKNKYKKRLKQVLTGNERLI